MPSSAEHHGRQSWRAGAVLAGAAVLFAATTAAALPPPTIGGRDDLESLFTTPISSSPDGRLVLYKVKRRGAFELRLRNTAGGSANDRLLDRSSDSQLASSWRPDGKALAFLEAPGHNQQFRLWLVDVPAGQRRRLAAPVTRNAALPLTWNGDGSAFTYVVQDGENVVVVVTPATDRYLRLPTPVAPTSEPAWTPDGRSVAVVPAQAENAVWILDARTGEVQRRLTVIEGEGAVRQVAFAAGSGLLLATARGRNDQHFSLRAVPRAGGAAVMLAAPDADVSDPLVAADGRIIYRVDQGGELLLRVIAPGGGAPLPLGPQTGTVAVRSLARGGPTATIHHTGRSSPPVLLSLHLASGRRRVLFRAPVVSSGPAPRPTAIPGEDGRRVPAILWAGSAAPPRQRPLLLTLVGGHGHSLLAWDPAMTLASRAGFDILAVDVRGSRGLGASWEKGTFPEAVADVLLARRHAVEALGYPASQVVLFGSSYGAALACAAWATAPAAFSGAVLLAYVPPPSPIAAATGPLGPVIAFHGVNDYGQSPAQARLGISALLGAGQANSVEMHALPREGHQFHRLESWAEVAARLTTLRDELTGRCAGCAWTRTEPPATTDRPR
jgi:dipeptidyl aminopeptidase/acylaminoacyl peptidase